MKANLMLKIITGPILAVLLSGYVIAAIIGPHLFIAKTTTSSDAQAAFDECQNFKKTVQNIFAYTARIDCGSYLEKSNSLPKDLQYQQVGDLPFSLALPIGSEFAKPNDKITDVYLLPSKIRKRPSQALHAFFISFQRCEDEWCRPGSLSSNGQLKQTWVDLDRKILIAAYIPGNTFSYYGLGIHLATSQYYYAQLNTINENESITPEQFETALNIIKSIERL